MLARASTLLTLCAAMFSLSADLAAAEASPPIRSVIVTAKEPTRIRESVTTTAGKCGDKEIAVRYFSRLGPQGERLGRIQVSSNLDSSTFDESVDFVRDIFNRPNSLYGVDIFCANDQNGSFFLYIWGVTLKSENGPAEYWTSKINFDGSAKLERYQGLDRRSYSEVYSKPNTQQR